MCFSQRLRHPPEGLSSQTKRGGETEKKLFL